MSGAGPDATQASACLAALRADIPVALGTSRIVRGAAGDAVLDAYVEAGGVALDSAAIYQRGESERIVGDWLARRKDAKVLVLTKGGHPDDEWRPRLDPASLRADLHDSLRRLNRDTVDIYLLHRDDETRPVEELVETLAGIREAGLARWIGVSNWRTPRLRQAFELTEIDLVSNLFGLGIPAGPPLLPGVVSSFDAAGHELLATACVPLLAWSAMSAGFFAEPPRTSDLALACEANPESVRRRQVLSQTAARFGRDADAIHIRWLATAAPHLIPLVGSSRAEHVTSLMRAAADPSLDLAVDHLVETLAQGMAYGLRRLLLPRTLPQW